MPTSKTQALKLVRSRTTPTPQQSDFLNKFTFPEMFAMKRRAQERLASIPLAANG